jgi:hypothetical protein
MAGFQSPNGQSTVYAANSINTNHFIKSLSLIRTNNMKNETIKNELLEVLSSKELEDENIIKEIPTKNMDELKEDIEKKLETNESKESLMKNVQNTINREKTDNKRKLSKLKAQKLTKMILNIFNIEIPEKLLNAPLKLKELFEEGKAEEIFKNCLNNEKRIVIIIDNYSVHKTYLSRIICLILNIKLIFLPIYSPFLNPIEQVWRTIKNILHRNSILDIGYLLRESIDLFQKEVDKSSYTKIWIETNIAKK